MKKWILILLIFFLQSCKSTGNRYIRIASQGDSARSLVENFTMSEEQKKALKDFYKETSEGLYLKSQKPEKILYNKKNAQFQYEEEQEKKTSYFSAPYQQYLEAKHQWLEQGKKPTPNSFEEIAFLSIHPFLLDDLKENARGEFTDKSLFPVFGREQAFYLKKDGGNFLKISLKNNMDFDKITWETNKDQGSLFLGEYNFSESGYCLALVDRNRNRLIYFDNLEGTGLIPSEKCDPSVSFWLIPHDHGSKKNQFKIGHVGRKNLALLDENFRTIEKEMSDISHNTIKEEIKNNSSNSVTLEVVPWANL